MNFDEITNEVFALRNVMLQWLSKHMQEQQLWHLNSPDRCGSITKVY